MRLLHVMRMILVALVLGVAPAVAAQSVDSPLRSAPVDEADVADETQPAEAAPVETAPAETVAPEESAPVAQEAEPSAETTAGTPAEAPAEDAATPVEPQQAETAADAPPQPETTPDETQEAAAPPEETHADPSADSAATATDTQPVEPLPDNTATQNPPELEPEPEPGEADAPPAVDPNGRPRSRMRLELLGAASVPSSGQDAGFAMGGFVGYDLWDRIGFEMLLAQTWSGTSFADGSTSNLYFLEFKPGLRYRLMTWNDNLLRVYVAVHGGLIQGKWSDPATGFDKYKEAFGFDGGAGLEYRFANIVLLDVFVLYEGGLNVAPVLPTSGYKTFHGLYAGLALGISSTME